MTGAELHYLEDRPGQHMGSILLPNGSVARATDAAVQRGLVLAAYDLWKAAA